VQFSLINTSTACRNLTDESLTRLAASCREAQVPLIWVIVPRATEIKPGGLLRRALNRATEDMRAHFTRLAADLDVPLLDLKPVLLSAQSRQEAYLPADAHWNEAGHQAVGQALLPVLLEHWQPAAPAPEPVH